MSASDFRYNYNIIMARDRNVAILNFDLMNFTYSPSSGSRQQLVLRLTQAEAALQRATAVPGCGARGLQFHQLV